MRVCGGVCRAAPGIVAAAMRELDQVNEDTNDVKTSAKVVVDRLTAEAAASTFVRWFSASAGYTTAGQPAPLLTQTLAPKFVARCDQPSDVVGDVELLRDIRKLVASLPAHNRTILVYLLRFLQKVAANRYDDFPIITIYCVEGFTGFAQRLYDATAR